MLLLSLLLSRQNIGSKVVNVVAVQSSEQRGKRAKIPRTTKIFEIWTSDYICWASLTASELILWGGSFFCQMACEANFERSCFRTRSKVEKAPLLSPLFVFLSFLSFFLASVFTFPHTCLFHSLIFFCLKKLSQKERWSGHNNKKNKSNIRSL